MPRATLVTLTVEQEQILKERASSPTASQRDVLRSRIILSCAEGWSNNLIAKDLQVSPQTICFWRKRFAQQGMAGLQEMVRRGRTSKLETKKVEQVLAKAVQAPANEGRWSCRSMAKAAGVSKSTVQKLWSRAGLKPHRSRTFKLSTDPNFDAKFWDVVGLYLSPPKNAIVLSCDEKSQIQALERTQPGLPMAMGHIKTHTHDYYRHGTVTLFAALDYATGKIISQTKNRHRHQEWLAFLKKIEAEVDPKLDIHIICDNYSTHKHAKVQEWLRQKPRFKIHFTPTSASWVNLVERFFRDISQEAILPQSFPNLPSLVASLTRYIAERNLNPKRYIWHANPHAVLEKINRAWEKLFMVVYEDKQKVSELLESDQANSRTGD